MHAIGRWAQLRWVIQHAMQTVCPLVCHEKERALLLHTGAISNARKLLRDRRAASSGTQSLRPAT
jgi:hypothetical protein